MVRYCGDADHPAGLLTVIEVANKLSSF
jgi:hypothetical protein